MNTHQRADSESCRPFALGERTLHEENHSKAADTGVPAGGAHGAVHCDGPRRDRHRHHQRRQRVSLPRGQDAGVPMGCIYQHEAEIFHAGRYRRNSARLLHGAGCAFAPGRRRILLRQLERAELEPAVRRDAGHGLRLWRQLRLRYAPGLCAACDTGHHLGVRLRLPRHDVPLHAV